MRSATSPDHRLLGETVRRGVARSEGPRIAIQGPVPVRAFDPHPADQSQAACEDAITASRLARDGPDRVPHSRTDRALRDQQCCRPTARADDRTRSRHYCRCDGDRLSEPREDPAHLGFECLGHAHHQDKWDRSLLDKFHDSVERWGREAQPRCFAPRKHDLLNDVSHSQGIQGIQGIQGDTGADTKRVADARAIRATRRAFGLRRGSSGPNASGDPATHSDARSDTGRHALCDSCSHSGRYGGRDAGAHGGRDACRNSGPTPSCDCGPDAHADSDTHADPDADPDAHADSDTDSHPDTGPDLWYEPADPHQQHGDGRYADRSCVRLSRDGDDLAADDGQRIWCGHRWS